MSSGFGVRGSGYGFRGSGFETSHAIFAIGGLCCPKHSADCMSRGDTATGDVSKVPTAARANGTWYKP